MRGEAERVTTLSKRRQQLYITYLIDKHYYMAASAIMFDVERMKPIRNRNATKNGYPMQGPVSLYSSAVCSQLGNRLFLAWPRTDQPTLGLWQRTLYQRLITRSCWALSFSRLDCSAIITETSAITP